VERDRRTKRQLRALGWSVVTVWECETGDPKTLTAAITDRINLSP